MFDMRKYEGTQFENLLSAAEAAEIWDLDPSAIRRAIMEKRLIEGRDCRKFGKQWVITVDAMARVFNRSACPADYRPWTNYKYKLRKCNDTVTPTKKRGVEPATKHTIP